MLAVAPKMQELFTDSIWLILYYIVLFSYLLFSLHYGNEHDQHHTMSTMQSCSLSLSSIGLLFSLSSTAWLPLTLVFFAGFELYNKRTRKSSIYVKQMLTNAVLAAEFYTVTVSEGCDTTF